ncbi:MAG TPA: serine hydroxymethyltransferase [Phycisphaerales bacterium]|nr:serine hydroxymethyltransferase [Phycisphaerales bacterium]
MTIHDQIVELIRSQDPEAAGIVQAEAERQSSTIELIASENHASEAVMHAAGTCMTNKYAEGYPGRRYYGGCEFHDAIERLAQDRAKAMFKCEYANVQPHSGAQANAAVFMAMMEPGSTFASLVLADGGHLSHGLPINFSGHYYKPVHYPLVRDADSPDFERIDYDAVRKVCLEHKPAMLLCGYSAYPRVIDFARFREIADEVGAILMADVAHISGLIVGGQHPSPFPHAHVVTTTTHKSLRGPRGGLILTNDEDISKKVNRALFPGMQGGPLMHIITAKAVAFGEALGSGFRDYQKRVVENARTLAEALTGLGYRITSGGTDNHLMLVDLTAKDPKGSEGDLTGKAAEKWLEAAGLITNKNGIPGDQRKPMVTSGLRLGTPAVTTRGFGAEQMKAVAGFIDRVLSAGLSGEDELSRVTQQVRGEVRDLCAEFPLHGHAPV